jgi:hypothetical protein
MSKLTEQAITGPKRSCSAKYFTSLVKKIGVIMRWRLISKWEDRNLQAKREQEELKKLVEDLERLVHKMRVTYTEVTTSDIVKLEWAVKVLKEVNIYGRK